ncbi:DUF2256 domain-containing protein [Acuticoccus sp.]|uniref:DUF2256 domain-containing protein n=1 Tax=Acuticoccus sp. TaxID=1904378 RepID=UPI003B51D4B2
MSAPFWHRCPDEPSISGKGRTTKESQLPQKTCVVCQQRFSRRKKLAVVWQDVKYCSARCGSVKTVPSCRRLRMAVPARPAIIASLGGRAPR